MAHPIHSYPYNLLAELLIARRQELGMLQTEVAERLNKPQSFVSKYENVGRRLDVIELIAVLKALEMTPYEFFDLLRLSDVFIPLRARVFSRYTRPFFLFPSIALSTFLFSPFPMQNR